MWAPGAGVHPRRQGEKKPYTKESAGVSRVSKGILVPPNTGERSMPKTTPSSVLASRPISAKTAFNFLLSSDPQHPHPPLTDISQRRAFHMTTTHRLRPVLKKNPLTPADAASQLYSLGP